jgi:hypothetical protein
MDAAKLDHYRRAVADLQDAVKALLRAQRCPELRTSDKAA